VIIESQDPHGGLSYFNKVWNRVCFCIYLFVFNALLFYWIDTIHTTVNAAFAKEALSGSLDFGFITPRGRMMFYLATGVVILLVLGLAIIRVAIKSALSSGDSDYSEMKDHVTNLEHANNLIVSVMFLVYGIFFVVYGTKLNIRVCKTSTDNKPHGVWLHELFSIGLLLCFVLRCIMFSYNILTGCEIEGDLFEILTYYVPELFSALLVLVSVNSSMFRDSERDYSADVDDVFVDPLLKEEEENEMALANQLP